MIPIRQVAITRETADGLERRIDIADTRYGVFASTHEALGVFDADFRELKDAIRANDIEAIRKECLDLAAPLIRLHDQLETCEALRRRSVK